MSKIDEIEKIAKQRGFFYPSSEIYGGVAGFYDYGHLGKLVKTKFEKEWKDYFLALDNNFVEIETCNIMPESVFKASGHLESFVDPIVKCSKCGVEERADYIIEDVLREEFEGKSPDELLKIIKKHNIKCPSCGGSLKEVGELNMMFPLDVGTGKNTQKVYLRPETAQGAYVNFRRQFEAQRKKLPLGLALVGRAYRNEISPRNLLIRMREFGQAELQIFFDPDNLNEHPKFKEIKNYKLRLLPVKNRKNNKIEEMTAEDANKKLGLGKFYLYYMAKMQRFYLDKLKINKEKFRLKELSEEERAFYNKYHWDIELDLGDFGGFKEVAGCHYRGSHDLSGHQKVSGQSMEVAVNGRKVLPHVVELSFGIDRNILAFLELGYVKEKERTLFKFPRQIAPYFVAVFPLVSKDKLPKKAKDLYSALKSVGFDVFYDGSGSIGRRYRRVDEIGVPVAITCDYQTLKNDTVTIRDRDSMKQIRAPIEKLCTILFDLSNYKVEFKDAGK